MTAIKSERVYDLTPHRKGEGNIVYWMSREQRVHDNPALLFAIQLAKERQSAISVVFTLTGNYPGAYLRHYDFMLRGLKEVELLLRKINISLQVLIGNPPYTIEEYSRVNKCGFIITDFDPLQVKRSWIKQAISACEAKFIEIDGHNIVPVRIASDKAEFGAYTIRPKINRRLEYFLEDFSKPPRMGSENYREALFNPEDLLEKLNINKEVRPVDWISPGENSAKKVMQEFISEKLTGYSENRNDPNKECTSNLSPYLHFGQIFSGRIVIEVLKNSFSNPDNEAFIEELVVRKELSDNFCHYNPDYDNVKGFHDWARKSHEIHKRDEREYIYSQDEFETAVTHDELWNAAQMQLVRYGKMHGYMRMYWAKKILEWTQSVEEAMEITIFLNDKYALDGRDPNGYTGIAWSVGGVHDRAWADRPVFGKVRYMNYNGCKRKFDVNAYINKFGPSN